ncbi:MAG: tRNA (N(6)-L-threonylcarbamoyladenosine(37)-C(2))-methylthiotransferase MtaB [Candidatus Marinimicrobia bacterium]|nr:tRNA (N(6)-L-threonylcarbamoyladenosine(37)-C(2))-methylthiotransferase MtaB [Candidatus Neomarinimicrobiota bacterium]
MNRQTPIKTVSFHTLGCKLNQAETDAIAADFKSQGYKIVPFRKVADLIVINTCTVTDKADSKSRQMIRNAIKASPRGRIVAMGCYAQIRPEELSAIDGIDMVLGTNEKYHLLQFLKELESGNHAEPLVYVNDIGDITSYHESPFISTTGRTRAYLKIQEGCDYYCSYCIIPFARGKARSRPFYDCLNEARSLVEKGYRELILTGINVGTWHEDDRQLADLLDGLSSVAGLERIRVSSIEPNTVSERLLEMVAERDNICPHLHIPLQSGSPAVLRRMRRKYLLQDYYGLAERIAKIAPDIAWGTDIITGFPGETEDEFQQTISAIQELPFTYLHIFRYSERYGTIASKLPGKVDFQVKKKRAVILRELSTKKKRKYIQKYIGRDQLVLFETTDTQGLFTGMTPNYIRVKVESDQALTNTIQTVKIIRDLGLYVEGQLLS